MKPPSWAKIILMGIVGLITCGSLLLMIFDPFKEIVK